MEKERIYILSTGRVGTTFLFNFFRKYYPEFTITHQTKWSRVINIIGHLPLKKEIKNNLIKFSFKTLKNQDIPVTTLDPLLSFSIAQLLGNKNPEDIKIVHLVRHPDKFAKSFMNWKSSSVRKLVLHYIVPFWQPVPLFHGVSFMNWIKMSKFEKFCWIWNYKNSKFNKLKEKYPYKLVSIESLTDDNKNLNEEWNSLLDFMNLTKKDIEFSGFAGEKVNKSKSKDLSGINNADKLTCKNYCEKLATSFGYTF